MHCHMLTTVVASLTFAFVAGSVYAQEASSLSAEELRAIVAKPHEDRITLRGLEVLPKTRVWDAAGHFIDAEGRRDPFKGKTTSKFVDGKYEVSQVRFEGHRFTLTMVTTWDAKSDTYYKYTVPPKGAVGKSVGIRVPDARAIAWTMAGTAAPTLTVETYGDRQMAWRSVMIDKSGEVTLITDGSATASGE